MDRATLSQPGRVSAASLGTLEPPSGTPFLGALGARQEGLRSTRDFSLPSPGSGVPRPARGASACSGATCQVADNQTLRRKPRRVRSVPARGPCNLSTGRPQVLPGALPVGIKEPLQQPSVVMGRQAPTLLRSPPKLATSPGAREPGLLWVESARRGLSGEECGRGGGREGASRG